MIKKSYVSYMLYIYFLKHLVIKFIIQTKFTITHIDIDAIYVTKTIVRCYVNRGHIIHFSPIRQYHKYKKIIEYTYKIYV